MLLTLKSLLRVFREGLLAQRDFRLMWLSSSITSVGGQITMLALPLSGVVFLNASASQMGILVALEALPFTLFSLQVGVVVDRARKLPILLAGEAAICLTLLAIPVMYWLGALSMPVLYAVGFLLGVIFVIVGTAAQVFLTHVAGRARLIEANSLFTASDSAARLTGPGVAGLLIQWLGAPYAILLDCAGFVVSFLLLGRIRFAEPAAKQARPLALTREIGEGLRLVAHHPILRTLTGCACVWFFLFQGFLALETLFASRELGLSAGQIGLAHMLGGVGALLAALSARRVTRRLGMGAPILLGMLSSGLSWIALAFIPRGAHAFALMGAALFFFDFGVTLYWINYSSLRQSVTPDALLGRMTATMRFFTVALAPVGAYCAGLLGEALGARTTLVLLGAAVAVLALAALAATNLRRVPDLSSAPRVPQFGAAPLVQTAP